MALGNKKKPGKSRRRQRLSEKFNERKGNKTAAANNNAAPSNPFDLQWIRQKQNVIGRRPAAGNSSTGSAVGKPTQSRQNAVEKRKKSLLVEYQNRHKHNRFKDRRLGESDPSLSLEEKMLQRFALQRKRRATGKPRRFHLPDDPTKAMPMSDDDDDDDAAAAWDSGKKRDNDNDLREQLGEKYVGEEHFGGGLLKKTSGEEKKTREERIDEIIAESKRSKAQKQEAKDEIAQMTDSLDAKWKELCNVVGLSSSARSAKSETAPPSDDYDRLVASLQLQPATTTSGVNPPENSSDIVAFPPALSDFRFAFAPLDTDARLAYLTKHVAVFHPSLGQENKARLTRLLQFLVKFMLSSSSSDVLKTVDACSGVAAQLYKFALANFHSFVRARLVEIDERTEGRCATAGQVAFLKLLLLLDGDHYESSVLLLLGKVLRRRTISRRASTLSLYCASLAVHQLQKRPKESRYMPELRAFLLRSLDSAPLNKLRVAHANGFMPAALDSPKIDTADFEGKELAWNCQTRLRCLLATLQLVGLAVDMWADIGVPQVAQPFQERIRRLRNDPTLGLPDAITAEMNRLSGAIEESATTLKPLSNTRSRPTPLPLLEPRLDAEFDARIGGRRSQRTEAEHAKATTKRLKAAHKREMKGAVREIRRDNEFLARQRLHEQLEQDKDRKQRVKQILTGLYSQQHEHNVLEKRKLRDKKKKLRL